MATRKVNAPPFLQIYSEFRPSKRALAAMASVPASQPFMRRLVDSSSRGPFARVPEPFGFYSPGQDIAFASMLEKICELAAKRGLPVLLIGGHAVIAHGHPRNTFDIDFVIEFKDQRAWRDLLEGLGYTLHAETRTFFQMQPSDEQTLPVDVMMVNDRTFAKMRALAKECSALPPDARVVSLEHLLALKCHAIKHGHPGRVEKDVDDVLGLVRANRLDVTSSDWREIFLKYGSPELYEKLRKARQKPSP